MGNFRASPQLSGDALENERATALSDLFAEVCRHDETLRVTALKAQSKVDNEHRIVEGNHHVNRTLQGLKGPNHYGIHLPHAARKKYNRGARGSWGLLQRS